MKGSVLAAVLIAVLTAVASAAAAVKPQTINLLEIDNSFTGTGIIPQGRSNLRVVNVVQPEREDEYPLLVVETAD